MFLRILGALAAVAVVAAFGVAPASAVATLTKVTPCGIFDNQVVAVPPDVLTAAIQHQVQTLPGACKALIDINKTVSNPTPSVGDQLQWTVAVHNPNAVTLPIVDVTDVLPSQGVDLLFSGAFPTKGSFSIGSGVWSIGSLAPGETEKLYLNEVVNGSASHINCADASVFAPALELVVPPKVTETLIPHLVISEKELPIALGHSCAVETPVVPSPSSSPGSSPTPTPTASTTAVTTTTSIGAPNTGRAA